MADRTALLIGSGRFDDDAFEDLSGPSRSVRVLSQALQEFGEFGIREAVDPNASKARELIQDFFFEANRDDTLLLYLCGHLVTELEGGYFVLRDTDKEKLPGTSISISSISDGLQRSRAQNFILIFDTLNTGFLLPEDKASVNPLPDISPQNTDASFEKEVCIIYAGSETVPAYTTDHSLAATIAEAIETGDSESDQGQLSVEELFHLVQQKYSSTGSGVTPTMHRTGRGKKVIIATRRRVIEESTAPLIVESGSGMAISREVIKLALDRDKYALSLARLFRIADGEFSIALLGRWGSGKTTVANMVSEYLSNWDKYKDDFREYFGFEPDEKGSAHKYDIVSFNAWRFRQKPELWIWLYETFVAQFLNCQIHERLLRTIRVGIAKHGVWQTLASIVLLAIVAAPLMWVSVAFEFGSAIFGITGIVGFIFLARRWRASLRDLVDRYGLVASHRAQLGLQALVGEDLKLLVKSWTTSAQFSNSERILFPIVLFVVAVVWLSGISGGDQSWIIEALASISTYDMGGNRGVTIGVSFVAWVSWCLVASIFTIALWRDADRVDRILLVVDDLDRCPQEEIVDMIDGIKLMIDDVELQEHVQAFVLADPTVLTSAIKHRFETVEQIEVGRLDASVREHLEKVFLCHVCVPELLAGDVQKLVRHFGDEIIDSDRQEEDASSDEQPIVMSTSRASGRSKVTATLESESATSENVVSSAGASRSVAATQTTNEQKEQESEDTQNQTEASAKSNPTDEMKSPGAALTLDELEMIEDALSREFGESNEVVTPRSVRSFLFKYQLARMLLQSEGFEYDTYELVSGLAAASSTARITGKPITTNSGRGDRLAWVIRLIA